MKPDIPSLSKSYSSSFKIGAAVSPSVIRSESGLITKHFNSITAENQMKFGMLHPEEDLYDFAAADEIAEFARSHRIDLRGHTLVWHNQTSDWVFTDPVTGGPASRELLLERLKSHMDTVVGRYKGLAYAWDVANEAIEDKTDKVMRETKWLELLGEDYILQAFRMAHEADPEALLFYNDYNETNSVKRQKIYNLVQSLLEQGAPIHGIGMQAHWNIYSPSLDEIREAIELYSSLGVQLHITELDISVFRHDDKRTDLTAPTAEMLELQAKRYEELFQLFREYRSSITSVTFWGVADTYTWLDDFPVRGRKNWPFLFDTEGKPKESFWRVAGLEPAWGAIKEPICKIPPQGNPLADHKFGADPYALVYGDRVYLYMTNDALERDAEGKVKENSYSSIHTITVLSSSDLANWTDHGDIPVAGSQGAAVWATQSWAPAAVHKVMGGRDKFFLYFANNASNIGVLTADSPTGPWTDPIGKPLITWETPGVADVKWLFDPAVLVDDDGRSYIYFGGGVPDGQHEWPDTARVMELGPDMISVTGTAAAIPAPYMFEDAGIHKHNGIYYYTYCSNFYSGQRTAGSPPAGEIAYMTASHPLGPWTFRGTLLRNPEYFFGVGGNNHHAVFQFRDQWYIAYHAQTLAKAMGDPKGYRSTHLNRLFHNEDGSIREVEADYQGVEQLAALDPYRPVKAAVIGWSAGLSPANLVPASRASTPVSCKVLAGMENGSWIGVSGVDFGPEGASRFVAAVGNAAPGSLLELRLDQPNGLLIGRLHAGTAAGGSGELVELETSVAAVSGVHSLFLIFTGNPQQSWGTLGYWYFKP